MKINNKEVTKSEALEIIEDESTVIKQVSVSFENENKTNKSAPSHEGFSIKKELISGASKVMSETNSGILKLSFKGSPKIFNRDLYILMVEPGHLRWWEKLILKRFVKDA